MMMTNYRVFVFNIIRNGVKLDSNFSFVIGDFTNEVSEQDRQRMIKEYMVEVGYVDSPDEINSFDYHIL